MREEAALALGAGGWQMFRRVTLPNIRWGLLYGTVLLTARAVGEFGAVSVVSGHIRGQTNTIPLHVEILYNEYNFTAAFAVASLLTAIALLTLIARSIIEWRSAVGNAAGRRGAGAGMSIEARGISHRFGSYQALDGIDLTVEPGQLVGLLGPSGSGKTTLLRIIAGLEHPDKGAVYLDGVDTTREPTQRRRVGFVFQHYALFNHLTIFENIAFGLRVRPRRERPPERGIRDRVRELLALVQLDGLAERYPSQLSGGQRQRVALARALAVEPRVLLLDEPFGALDARVRKDLRRWLRRLHDELHVTSVFVTHDQEEALELSDRVVVMNHGKIEQEGTPDEVYHSPSTPFVYRFLGDVNLFHGRIEGDRAARRRTRGAAARRHEGQRRRPRGGVHPTPPPRSACGEAGRRQLPRARRPRQPGGTAGQGGAADRMGRLRARRAHAGPLSRRPGRLRRGRVRVDRGRPRRRRRRHGRAPRPRHASPHGTQLQNDSARALAQASSSVRCTIRRSIAPSWRGSGRQSCVAAGVCFAPVPERRHEWRTRICCRPPATYRK